MCSNDTMIRVNQLSKLYRIYEHPRDRLKQFLYPRLNKYLGRSSTNYFREFWALQDVSFELKKGETFGIIGRNGSGKSTLLQIIAGTLNPTFGNVEVNGRVAALLELGAGFNPEFTGRENIYLNASILGLAKELVDERVSAVIEFAGLADYIDQPMKTYSSGMYARLGFAAAIHVDPDILIVDEALAVGDAGFQLKCMLKMREMQDNGVTVLFVSHDMGSVVRLCDRAIVLDKGALVPGDQDPQNCVKRYEQITRNAIAVPDEYTGISGIQVVAEAYAAELEGIEEKRFGTHEAEYLNVNFYADDGKPRTVFNSGDEITITAVIKSSKQFKNVLTGFTLKNKSGVDVWGDNSLYANTPLSLAPGLSKLSYRFNLSIPAGEYFLYIGLAESSDKRVELDQRWPVRKITVVSSREVLGYAFAPANITLEELK